MPTTTSITTTYAGESAGKYIASALLSSNTIEQGGISVMPNIKYKEVIKRLSLDGIVKDASCDFTDTSTLTLDEKILTPEEFQVNLELCKSDFASDWEAAQMGFSAFDQLPPSFSEFFIARVLAKIALKNEQNIWQGVNATAGEYDGLTTLIAADADLPAAQEIAGTTITSANVIDQLGLVVDALPSALYGREDLHIYIPQNVFKAYVRALGGFAVQSFGTAGSESAAASVGANGLGGQGTTWYGGGNLTFDGVKLFVANGMPSNKMMATTKDNLYFGTGLLNDLNEVRVLDMADLDGSKNVRFISRFTAGVQYGHAEDIVTYGITNSAN